MDMKEVLDMADKEMYRVKLERKAIEPEASNSWMVEELGEKAMPAREKDEVH